MSTTPATPASGVVAETTADSFELAQRRSLIGRFTPSQLLAIPPIVLFIVLFIVMVVLEGTFSGSVLDTVLETTVPLILVGFGQTLVVLTGGIDLSVGGVFALTTGLAATKMTHNSDLAVWIPLLLIMGLLAGAINGWLIVRTKMQPFIVTLASWSVFDGLALIALPTDGGSVAPGLSSTLSGDLGINKAILITLAVILVWVALRRTRFGTNTLAIGSSEASAVLNGVPVGRTKIVVYALSGLFAVLGAIYYSSVITFSGSPTSGDPFILQSVAAVVIGGASLAGGRGNVIGTVLGACSLSMIAQIVFFAGAQSYWSQVFQGGLILAAVLLFAAVEMLIRRRNPVDEEV
jgi:ribose transport system permease protein